jgi:hypothetical protein
MTQSQTKFVCVERTGKELYNYFNGALPQAQADHFEEHLFCCFYCQERFHHLEWIYGALSKRSAEKKRKHIVKTASSSSE